MSENRQDGFICTLCGSPAEFREDEGIWRHAGGPMETEFAAQQFCNKYGYPIKVGRKKPNEAPAAQPASILGGVFDHQEGCRAPDYGPCTCVKPAPLTERPASLKNIEEWLPYADSVRITKLIQYALKLERERLSMERRREWADRLDEIAEILGPGFADELRAIAKELRDAG